MPTPNEKQGYNFIGWYDNSNFTGSPISVITSNDYGNKNFYARYELKTFTITVIQAENGVISDASPRYNYGSNAHFTFTANYGYHVEHILIDGEIYTDNLSEYTFTNITENHTISLICSPETYTIRYFDGPTEINGLLPSTYSIGSSFKLPTPIEKQGHDFIGWYDNSSFSGLPITNISVKDYGNKTLYARYELKTFTITVIQAENGVTGI